MFENDIIIKKTSAPPASKELVSELTLPDYLPDVSRLLRTDAAICSPRAFVGDGTIGCDGEVNYTIVYATSDGRIKSVPLSADLECALPLPGPSGDYDVAPRIKTESIGCRLQNPRRMTVRTKLSVGADAYSSERTEPQIAGESTPAIEQRIQKKTEIAESAVRVCASDEDVPVSEDVELDAREAPVSEIVSVSLSPYLGEVRAAADSISYRGEITAQIVYLAAGDDKNENAEYFSVTKKIPVSGEVYAEGVTADFSAFGFADVSDVEYRPQANAYGENRVIEIDLSYTAHLCALKNTTVGFVFDMYSVDRASENEMQTVENRRVLRAGAFNFSFDGSSALDDREHTTVVSCSASADIDIAEKAGTKAVFSGKLDVSVILTDGGGSYIGRSFSFPLRAETDVGRSVGATDYEAYPSVLGASAVCENGEIVCEAEVGVAYAVFDVSNAEIVKRCVVKSEQTEDSAGALIVICYPQSGDSLWSVAKRYGVPTDKLRSENSLSPDSPLPAALVIPAKKN